VGQIGPTNVRVTLTLRQTDTLKWVCEFTLKGKDYHFTGSDPAGAVMAAAKFLETQGGIGLMRIIEQG
jgi:hypothetical protein